MFINQSIIQIIIQSNKFPTDLANSMEDVPLVGTMFEQCPHIR